jgi:hypothetical protein
MKKILLIATTTAALSGLSAFGQGQFVFSSNAKVVWDGWSVEGFSKPDANNNVAFLIGTGTPLVDSIQTSAPTNANAEINGLLAWNYILNDPNFRLATNAASGALASVQTTSLGGINYNGGSPFQVSGTSSSGGNITIFVIAWQNIWADPFVAALSGGVVGWSAPFTYSYAAGPVPGPPGFPDNFSTAGLQPFGVTVPEPSTFVLGGLVAAAMLIFRRRKQ